MFTLGGIIIFIMPSHTVATVLNPIVNPVLYLTLIVLVTMHHWVGGGRGQCTKHSQCMVTMGSDIPPSIL